MKRAIARYLNGKIHVYRLTDGVDGPLDPVTTYSIDSEDEKLHVAVAPDLNRIAYATGDNVACISQNGEPRWKYKLEPPSSVYQIRIPQCVFSLDGAWLWVYRPDAMNDRGPDILVVLCASTGEVVAQVELGSVGEASQIALHPDGRHVLLDVGEGQDGVNLYRAALPDGHDSIDLHSYGWNDRFLIDVSPDGRQFMTIDHGRYDVAFHAFPDGKVISRLAFSAFDDRNNEDSDDMAEEEELLLDWSGGFLNSDIAIVTLAGEKDDKEWHRHFRVDLRTGQPQGDFEAHSRDIMTSSPLVTAHGLFPTPRADLCVSGSDV